MLKYIDIFIGVALVMLGLSLIVTVVTQVVSFAANFRGTQLRKGLAELFSTLSSRISGEEAEQIADKLLHHRLIADGLGRTRLAPAVSRADLVNLLSTPELLAGALGQEAASKISLDAFGLVKQLHADSDLRASLVGATTTMLDNAQQVLSPPPLYRDAAATLAGDPKNGLPAPPASLTSRDEAKNGIRGNVGDSARETALVKAYDDLLGTSLQRKIPALVDKAVAIKAELQRADSFRLTPNHPPWDYESLWVFLGVLTSATLLSLGAPFWFNMLKTASNLRPAIAAYVDGREPTAQAASDQKSPAPLLSAARAPAPTAVPAAMVSSG